MHLQGISCTEFSITLTNNFLLAITSGNSNQPLLSSTYEITVIPCCSQKPSVTSASPENRCLVLYRHLYHCRASCSGKGRAARRSSQAVVLALVQRLTAPFCSAGYGFPAWTLLNDIWWNRSKNKSTFGVECTHSSLSCNFIPLVCIMHMLEACCLVALHSTKACC